MLKKGLDFFAVTQGRNLAYLYIKTNKQKPGKLGAILVTSMAVITVRTSSAHPLGRLRGLGRLPRSSLVGDA